MALSDPGLWQRLGEFQVSPPAAVFSFNARLARENRWSRGFAERAFAEYLRFLYLRVVAGRQMTPSDPVERVWRLHLGYGHSYGQELCRGVLGRVLHHPPTGEGPAERAGVEVDYRRTLATYEREFGTPPPAEIWPPRAFRSGARPLRRAGKGAKLHSVRSAPAPAG